ncbi:CpsD/CapB family tyrosine-protein kinase [Ruegeria atlantica]|uniref:Tyrosine-protein kinase YwqD n=1 Tax=Ruegeria atlantica TaxID=81569 RepID=A0A0P1EFX8_9RHOB|nr:CpsD/CapB family tyrosine-protein kinase [Ruegeria atlantica]CUH49061.1 Tyrosine-protein kinase YwqD [Ruegeria atlantica]
MEKLQKAIEKARSQRRKRAPAQLAVAADKAIQEEVPSNRTTDPWLDLTPLDISKTDVRQNRLVSYDGGAAAGPYDMLRTRILQQALVNGWKRVAMVSPHSACGKSTTTANLAFSFGRQTDLRTVVLDFDLRRAGLSLMLKQDCQCTMGDILQGKALLSDHGYRVGKNVALGLSSGAVTDAAEILQSQKASDVIAAIEAEFEPDLVLFDMPPLLAADDNFGFLKNADCALLMTEAERTTIDQIDVAERQLAELTNVMGVIMNKCHYTDGIYGYGYGYGYS